MTSTPTTTEAKQYERLVIEERGPVQTITLNRPERRNALDPTMIRELADHFASLPERPSIRVVVLQGAGQGFCSGLDVKATLAGELDRRSRDRIPEIITGIRDCPQIVVALVHGAACGGGFAMALAADIRILGDSARMNSAVVQLGGSGCELGLSYFLPRYVGLATAAELLLTGRVLDSKRASELGLASQVVPDELLASTAEDLIEELLAVAPLALRRTKETLRRVVGVDDLASVIDTEMAVQRECLSGPEFHETLRARGEGRQRSAQTS